MVVSGTSASDQSSTETGEPTGSESDAEAICLKDFWPRVIGTSPIVHSRLVDKGKAPKMESSSVRPLHVTCPKDVEGECCLRLNY